MKERTYEEERLDMKVRIRYDRLANKYRHRKSNRRKGSHDIQVSRTRHPSNPRCNDWQQTTMEADNNRRLDIES